MNRPAYLAPIAVLLGIALSAGAATPPNPGDLARCAEIAAPDARLACYDALTGGAARATPTAPARPPPPSVAPSPTPAVPVISATPAPPALPAAASIPPPAPAPTPALANAERNFGLSPIQVHKTPEGPAAIQARIAKIVNNTYGRNYVVLDNGQTWTYTDSEEDARLAPGDQVTIKRASLGSFLMKTPSKHAYHVRRTQ